MVEILGDFIEEFPPEQDSLELKFTPSSQPIRKRWRTHRLSAHFVANYFSTFLPIDDEDPESGKRIRESEGAVSYVANELLENAMKFNDETTHCKIRFGIHFIGEADTATAHHADVIAAIFTTNSIKPEGVDSFQQFINTLLASDPGELYLQHLEKSAELGSETSGLGLLTMANDYAARLGWRFETVMGHLVGDRPSTRPIITVTTMAQIRV